MEKLTVKCDDGFCFDITIDNAKFWAGLELNTAMNLWETRAMRNVKHNTLEYLGVMADPMGYEYQIGIRIETVQKAYKNYLNEEEKTMERLVVYPTNGIRFDIHLEDAKYWSGIADDIVVDIWDRKAKQITEYLRHYKGIISQNDSADVKSKVKAVKIVYKDYVAKQKISLTKKVDVKIIKDRSLLSKHRSSKRQQKQMISKCNRVLIMTPDVAIKRGLL